jgi:hypothetical protein
MRKIYPLIGFLTVIIALAFGAAAPVRAADNDIQLSSTLTREDFKSLTRQLGFAASYFPLAPAASLGILGFDAGVEATAVKISRNSSFWQRAVQDSNPPSYLVIPRLHVQKGLPFNLDIGASYAAVPSSDISLIGGEIKWAILSGGVVAPAVAVRISGTKLFGGSQVHLETYSVDLSISKGFLFLIPYAGIGQLLVNSRTDSAAIRLANGGVDFRETQNLTKGFVGLKIAPPVIPFSLVAEADFSTVTAYSIRANFSF